jgi:hypothetical protein
MTAGSVSDSSLPYLAASSLATFDDLTATDFLCALAATVIFPLLLVVFLVRQNVQNINLLAAVIDVSNQPIFISADVEDRAFAVWVCSRENFSHLGQVLPRRLHNDLRPYT